MNNEIVKPNINFQAHFVYDQLNRLHIPFEVVHHGPIFTSNRNVPELKDIDMLDIKNLFLKGHKGRRHYLVVMPYDKALDLKRLAGQLGEKSLSMASADRLAQYLGAEPGGVSIFGLLNPCSGDVVLVVDPELMAAERVGFHPNIPTQTLILTQQDFTRFLKTLPQQRIEMGL